MKTKILFIAIIVGLVLIGVTAIKKKKEEISKIPPPKIYPISVKWTTIKSGELQEEFNYIGTFQPYKHATISTKIYGTVLKVYKSEGDFFKKGELLAKIDDSEIKSNISALEEEKRAKENLIPGLRAELRAAEIALKNAKEEFNREKFLYEKGAVPKVAVEKVENQLAIAESKVESIKAKWKELKSAISSIEKKIEALKSQLKYTEIRALDDGVVSEVLAYEGSLATPGKPIIKVYYPKYGFKILINIPPEDAKEIPIDSPVFKGEKKIGKLVKYYPSANENFLYIAEIKVNKSEKIKPFENVSVKVLGKPYKGQIVPIYAILHLKNGDYVLSVEQNNKVKPVKIKVLKTVKDKAIISSNLQEGTKVIVGRESKLLEVMRRGSVVLSEAFDG
ncbi:efflux transporter, RND family, MFP subunit [Desulfurobacterium thermolithotrophum DSM 11699]|uniref:Efflux transporter, RND family, MFP subunit n=1 Tax=Desulfurobacterium thermolithotrophum (strain DSM 11699 / BSA) TaxID=868864 RepID=F0S294_DESTD|nr:efflux RND transporter periplasmic adaptor subunit [Desulfurobacterium thermolithotrophum]ADY74109.1 efflux transporter, RND family, MFP subunit [Desulfurobacterium thermolithotrophum DSM 11699]